MRPLAAVDAQAYWMSKAIPSDEFLVYGFAGQPADLSQALGQVRVAAQSCGELRLRIAEPGFWNFPVWERCDVIPEQVVVHEPADRTWPGCLAAVTALFDDQLDEQVMTWRLHVFPAVEGVPGGGTGAVAVVQISHALGDGKRCAALAAHLLGRGGDVPAVAAPRRRPAEFPRRVLASARAHRRLVRDTEAGLTPPQALSRPPLRTNARPSGLRCVRTVIRHRAQIGGQTVTVAALTAVSAAMAAHLRQLGDDPALLGAEVPMARLGPRIANNHYGNVGVGLHPDAEAGERARRIAAELHRRRRRAAHTAMHAESAAFAAMPAPLLRWGVAQFDPAVRSPTVTGNTVVSSVNRGAADLGFGGAPVVLTTGFPGLSPMMGLTHGVHGIGDTIAIGVHAAESAVGDIDSYVERLEYELRSGS